ncbi:MAG: type II toxin-antitoxin system RelE/ParE family toxin [Phycisphaeraceae bacterium]|nr:type II toxin-antitoxin system RelE/ParE family toxin [Phycisphaeraceae bacterium]
MSSRFVLTFDAVDDLGAIVRHLQNDSPANAVRLIDEFESTFSLIARKPKVGHRRTDLADEALRVFPVHSFVVIYRPETSPCKSSGFCTALVTFVRCLRNGSDLPRCPTLRANHASIRGRFHL